MGVSIIIKAWNEGQHIEGCVQSALDALTGLDGEVILVDSHSTDDTVAKASRFPITIVQPEVPDPGRCGLPPQIGYQHSRGAYCYILDGDMILEPGFLHAAVAALEENPALAGVAGLVEEVSEGNNEFRGRKLRGAEAIPGPVRGLDMGGLYRRQAIEDVGYFSNRNLHAFEELDLGLRLEQRGWKLERLDVPSVVHHGHTMGSLELIRKRWNSGYVRGRGEILRSFLGERGFGVVVWRHNHLLATIGTWLWALCALVIAPLTLVPLALLVASYLVLFIVKVIRRGPRDALISLLVWQVSAAGMVLGLLAKQQDPRAHVGTITVAGGAADAPATQPPPPPGRGREPPGPAGS